MRGELKQMPEMRYQAVKNGIMDYIMNDDVEKLPKICNILIMARNRRWDTAELDMLLVDAFRKHRLTSYMEV